MTNFLAPLVFLVFLGENDISAHAISEETTLSPKPPRQEAASPISEAQQPSSSSTPARHPIIENLKNQEKFTPTPPPSRKKPNLNSFTRQPKD